MAHYARGLEADRLVADGPGMLEFARTTEIISRLLPTPPAVVADIGGGPGGTPRGWPSGATWSSIATSCGRPARRAVRGRAGRAAGWAPPLHPGSFSGYCHRPGQLRAEVRAAGLDVADLVNVEGVAWMLPDLAERLADQGDRQIVLDSVAATEWVPELLGVGPHLLVTAVRRE
jgi:hypothetical protein